MTADELARVTAERDAARDEVTRLNAELTGVRASLVEQAEDAEGARATVATRTQQLREALAERDAAVAALARLEALAGALVREYDAACPDWWPDAIGPLRDALGEAGTTRDGPASPEGPVAGRVGTPEPDRCPDCEWVERPQRWADAANGVEPELVLSKPCRKHGGPCGECQRCISGHWPLCQSPAAMGVHVDRAPDPRPQQIIDDPAGWFDAAREKARRDIRDQERR